MMPLCSIEPRSNDFAVAPAAFRTRLLRIREEVVKLVDYLNLDVQTWTQCRAKRLIIIINI